MTQLYTGQPYGGQNNLTAQGCFHASITYGAPETKALAVKGLKALMSKDRTNVQGMLDELGSVPTAERAMLEWALRKI